MSKLLSKFTDEQLVVHVREVDKEAFVEIIRRYQNKLMRYAVYLLKDEDRAADVVQSALIKVYQNLYGFNVQRKFSSWIYRIVHNLALNLIKKDRRIVSMPENLDWESEENIESDFFQKEIEGEVKDCLLKLPIEYREPLSLFFWENKSYNEISDILRLPTGTVGTRINRGKALIKKICQRK